MSLRIREKSPSRQRVTGVKVSPATAALLRCDAAGWADQGESFSFVLPVVVNEPGNEPVQAVVFEMTSADTKLVHSLVYESDGESYWRFAWHVGDSQPKVVGTDIGFNPTGKVCAVALSYQRASRDSASSKFRLCTYVPGMAATGCAEALAAGTRTPGMIASIGIGHSLTNISPANMLGCFVLWVLRSSAMSGLLVVDGRTLDEGVGSVNVRSLMFNEEGSPDFCGCAAAFPAAVLFAINHSASGRMWNGYQDLRPGKTTTACAAFDRNALEFPRYWNRCDPGVFTGVIEHVNPYQAAGITHLPRPSKISLQPGVTAPFSNVGPLGSVGPQAARLIDAADGAPRGQLNVVFAANSRGVTAYGPAELQLESGVFTGRTLLCTYPEAGIASLTALWEGGLVGMSNLPVPTGLYTYGADETEAATDAAEPLFGADCALIRPRCRDLATNTPVAVKVATTKLVSTSYSRVWGGSRYASSVAGVTARYRGNGAPRSVSVGFEYRLLIRPEIGMPASEGLEVGCYVLRNPLASTCMIRRESASSQSGDGTRVEPFEEIKSDLDNNNVSSAVVLVFNPPIFEGDLKIVSDGWVVINNTNGAMTQGHVGQWLELSTSTNARRDITCIKRVDDTSPAACRVYVEGTIKNVPVTGSDRVHWLTSPSNRYRDLTVSFAPNEVGGWRGLSIGVSPGTEGLGVDMLGVHFRNTSRAGVIAGQTARSGCGFAYQDARYFYSATPALGTSPFQEMVSMIKPDLLILCTADQGDTVSFADVARETMTRFARRWTAANRLIEPVLYSTGPELFNEGAGDYAEDAKACFHVVYAQAAADLGAPHLSVYYDLSAGTGCMNSHLTGENTESRTHPSTCRDVQRMIRQLKILAQPKCAADFNGDGGVDYADVEDFWREWMAGERKADVNQDGGVDGADVAAFYTDWEAGGC
jgi:hypothetical protein